MRPRNHRARRRALLAIAAAAIAASSMACATLKRGESRATASASQPPAEMLGAFQDDYDGTYVITKDVWQHGPRAKYEIVAWHSDSQYVIAHNAATNPSDAGLWTRIDWLPLTGTPPYFWAYCLSAYKAPTAAAAEATKIAKRETPRTGCNGFPFSRMKRAAPK